jgi:arylsulfatase A-like enzyme
MNKFNIYWFIIDSVRTFKTGLDDRDRIEILDELGDKGIEFNNCVTSAPSSLLSAGAMFTGLPSTFVARHFNEMKLSGLELSSIATLVQNHNYVSHPILDTRNQKEHLQTLLPPLKHKELPKGYKLTDYVWHNDAITEILKHQFSNEDPNKNHAYIMWYDCRRDPKTNDHVKEAIDAIKEKGDFDKSIIIMHSDHGYPDPRTKLNEEYFKGIGHDMILTDDNIKVPLVIKYPKCQQGIKIDHQVGLIDVLPSIFDILKIEYKKLNTSFQGQSLLPIINGKEKDLRIRNSDTRLPLDVNRMSCLRNNKFKYLYLYNDRIEILYDLVNDPEELTNVIHKGEYKDIHANFKRINLRFEEELFLFHDKQVKANLGKSMQSINKIIKEDSPRIVIVTKAIELLIKLLVKELRKEYDNPKIFLILSGGNSISIGNLQNVYSIEKFDKESISKLALSNIDVTIFLTENSSRVFLKKDQVEGVKSIGAKKSLLMNYNFVMFNYFTSKWLNITYIKLFFDWETKGYFYKQEPSYFLKDIGIFINGLFKRIINRVFKKNQNIDLKAARESIHYRQSILKTNESKKYASMNEEDLSYELERLKTRDE